jgi:hypothetical protein
MTRSPLRPRTPTARACGRSRAGRLGAQHRDLRTQPLQPQTLVVVESRRATPGRVIHETGHRMPPAGRELIVPGPRGACLVR